MQIRDRTRGRRMPDTDDAVRAIALDLYAAVLDGHPIEVVLARIAASIGAETAFATMVSFTDGSTMSDIRFAQFGFDPDALVDDATTWLPQDPRMQIGGRLAPGVINFADHIAPEAMVRSVFWNEFNARRAPAFHSIATSFAEPGDVTGIVAFQRPQNGEPFGAAETRLLGQLYPHIKRAFTAEARLAAAGPMLSCMVAGLDTMRQGVAVIGPDGHMRHANVALVAMAAQRDGLAIGHGGVVLADPRARAALAQNLTATLGTAGMAAQSVVATRPSGATPWLLQVLPLTAGGHFAGTTGALLRVTDVARRGVSNSAALRQMFGLTASEAALAAALAGGDTIAGHARQRGVALETMRSHLANVRRKTGCRRQADLVALVVTLS